MFGPRKPIPTYRIARSGEGFVVQRYFGEYGALFSGWLDLDNGEFDTLAEAEAGLWTTIRKARKEEKLERLNDGSGLLYDRDGNILR